MQYIIQTYGDYDPTVYGTPWGAPCDSSGRPCFQGTTAHFTGGRGKGGDLFAEDPIPDSVWAYGQKNYRSGQSEKHYALFHNGGFYPVAEMDLLAILQSHPQIPSVDRRNDVSAEKHLQPKAATHHIRLSPQEDQLLRKRAEQAGMQLSPFIKRAALHASIKVLDLTPLTQHALVLSDIARDIHTAAQHIFHFLCA